MAFQLNTIRHNHINASTSPTFKYLNLTTDLNITSKKHRMCFFLNLFSERQKTIIRQYIRYIPNFSVSLQKFLNHKTE